MNCIRVFDPALLSQGVFYGTRLNPLVGNVSTYGTPAIVADVDPLSTSSYTGQNLYNNTGLGSLTFTTGNSSGNTPGWAVTSSYVKTSVPGDYFEFTCSSYAVDIDYISNTPYGGIAHVLVDGQPSLSFSSLFTNNSYYSHRVYLDGTKHTVRVTNLGDFQTGALAFGSPHDVSGTAGLATSLFIANIGTPFAPAQTWTCYGTTSSTVSVYNGSYTYMGLLTANIANDNVVPGLTMQLTTGSWDITSVANFSTYGSVLELADFKLYTALSSTPLYVTPIMDSGNILTEWPFFEIEQGPNGSTPPTMVLYLSPDGVNFSEYTLGYNITADPSGNNYQRIVYSPPRGAKGRYAYLIGQLPPLSPAWTSDYRIWNWVPETDDYLNSVPSAIFQQPNNYCTIAAEAAILAYLNEQADELALATSVSTSVGYYLYLYGQQYNLVQLPNEGFASYRTRILALTQGRNPASGKVGGSQPFLQSVLSGALLGKPSGVSVVPLARSGTSFVLGFSTLGNSPLGSNVSGFWTYQVTIPLSQLLIPVEDAQSIVKSGYLKPLGYIPYILFS